MKIYYHDNQALHHPQTYFSRGKMRQPQDTPARLVEYQKGVEAAGLTLTSPDDLGIAPIQRVHGHRYLHFLRTAYQEWHKIPDDWGEEVIPNIFVAEHNALKGILAKAAYYIADGSAPIGAQSWEAIYWSAQSALNGAKDLYSGARRSMAISRPSGHHARRERAGGFCFLNNAAIAAEYLFDTGVAEKIVIFDTDIHHGQGIQEIFYHRSDLLYLSIHADPTNFYPVVAGFEEERGEGEGVGYNINIPFPHGATEEEYFLYFEQALAEIESFAPDMIIHNMGFDLYKKDPQTKTAVTQEGIERIAASVASLNLPTLYLIEGGYYLPDLGDNLRRFINVVMDH